MRILVRFGSLWLGVVGAVALLAGAGCTLAGLGSLGEPPVPLLPENPFRDVPKALLAIGLVQLAFGVANITASVGIANQRTWGRWLGLLIALVVLVPLVLFVEPIDLGLVLWPPAVIGYGLTALGLLVWYPSEMLLGADTPAPAPEAGSAAGSPGAPRPSNREQVRSVGLSVPGVRFAYAEAEAGGQRVAEETIRQARTLVEREACSGRVLVEAVWQDHRYSSLGLAFGEPGVAYARRWPDGDDVKDLVVPSGSRHS